MTRPKRENYSKVFSKRLNEEYEHIKDKDNGYTKKEFAYSLGLEETFLNKLMKDKNPTLEVLIKVSEKWNCNINWLIREDVPKNINPSKEEIEKTKISKYIGLSIDSIEVLHNRLEKETNKNLDTIITSIKFDELDYLLDDYFNYDKTKMFGALVIKQDDSIDVKEDNGVVNISFKGYVDDFYDSYKGKRYLNNDKYETIVLDDISNTIKEIKKYSSLEETYIKNRIEELKKELNKESKKNKANNEINITYHRLQNELLNYETLKQNKYLESKKRELKSYGKK